jgi:hypothetical protein
MRHALLPVAVLFMIQTTVADAQADRTTPTASQVPARINIGMNISQRLLNNSVEEQRRTERAVRRRLYEMAMEAMEECMLLVDVFQAECRISSLNLNSTIQDQGDVPMIHGNVNGQYEIIPRR